MLRPGYKNRTQMPEYPFEGLVVGGGNQWEGKLVRSGREEPRSRH